MAFLSHIFRPNADRGLYRPLYEAVVAGARNPIWYREGQVPDTMDGRFDMIAAMLALVLLRLESEGKKASKASALIAETFIDDMEGSIRQIGIGDLMVGKHVGKMMGALGGRIGAFRNAVEAAAGFDEPVRRNIFHDAPLSEAAVALMAGKLEDFHRQLAETPLDLILAGESPRS